MHIPPAPRIRGRRLGTLTGLVTGVTLVIGSATVEIPATAAGSADDAAILHVLNRVSYGPRPGDLEKVRTIGIDAYLEEQLFPDRIDDRALSVELARFETLELDTPSLVLDYHLPSLIVRRERQLAAARAADADGEEETGSGLENQTSDSPNTSEMLDPFSMDEGRRRRDDVPPEIRRGQLIVLELIEQKLVRAVSSQRQLQEVLVDFWFNHFNVSLRKSPLIQPYLVEYERDVLRPHVLGSFRDLLGAVAESPAMLIYLDNWLSSDPDAPAALTSQRALRPSRNRPLGGMRPRRLGWLPPVQPGPRSGLNENYARELLELHTLGVDGGYTQADVVAVARALTGWTIRPLRAGGGFRFESRLHDDGDVVLLGSSIDGRGKAAGDEVLDRLARHPATAHHIATKLASWFVADDPPDPLVDMVARRFTETNGDLREVMRALLTSDAFTSPGTRGVKVKTPLEFVVSSVRMLDGHLADARALALMLRELGMPLYACQPPTGYSDLTDAWVNTGALLGRMNFAVALAGARLPGVHITLPGIGRQEDIVRELFDTLLMAYDSGTTRQTLARAKTAEQYVALAIGSPAFQRQ